MVWHKDYGLIYDIKKTSNMGDILYESKKDEVYRKILKISLL